MKNIDARQAAHSYRKAGFSVIPIKPDGRPYSRLADKSAPNILAALRRWWAI